MITPTIVEEKISSKRNLKWWEESFERGLELPDDGIAVVALVNCDVFMEKVWIPSGDGKYSRAYDPLKDKDNQEYIKREPFLKQSEKDNSSWWERFYKELDSKPGGRFVNKRCLLSYYYFHSSSEVVNAINVEYTTLSRGLDRYEGAVEEIRYKEEYRLVRDSISCCRKVAGFYDSNDVPFYFTDKAGKECYDEEAISDLCYECRPSILGEKSEEQW